jgi:hypothetical protein
MASSMRPGENADYDDDDQSPYFPRSESMESPIGFQDALSRSTSTTTTLAALTESTEDKLHRFEQARNCIELVGPRHRKMVNLDDNDVRIIFYGCQGDPGDNQNEVAALLKRISEKNKTTFRVILGDNAYEKKAMSTPHQFEKIFHRVFIGDDTTPNFMIPGNHDYGLEFGSRSWGRENAINELICTYLHNPNETTARFTKSVYDLKDAQPFNFPYYFDSYEIGDYVQLFLVDSSYYLMDLCALLRFYKDKNPTGDTAQLMAYFNNPATAREYNLINPSQPLEHNQAYFLKQHYDQAATKGKDIIFAQHHPLIMDDARAFPEGSDCEIYLDNDSLQLIQDYLGTKSEFYNQLLEAAYQKQGMQPDKLFSAHRHAISYINKPAQNGKRICYVTTGAGGNYDKHKHPRESLQSFPDVGIDLIKNGVVELVFNPKVRSSMRIIVHTIDGLEVHFDDQHANALQQPNANTNIQLLRHIITTVYNKFIETSNNKEIAERILADRALRESENNPSLLRQGGQLAGGFLFFAASLVPIVGSKAATFANNAIKVISKKANKFIFNSRTADYKNEIRIADELRAYFDNRHLSNDYQKVCNDIIAIMRPLANKQQPDGTVDLDSFYMKLNTALMDMPNIDLVAAHHIDEPAAATPSSPMA